MFTDSAVMLKINGVIIIDHHMSDPKKAWNNAGWGDKLTSKKVTMKA